MLKENHIFIHAAGAAKNCVTASLLGNFIEFIVNSSAIVEYRLEILKNINIILENCPISIRQDLLSTDDFVDKFKVYSFPAESVKIDGEKVYKPSDDECDMLWIDFNSSSERIGFFIEPNFPQSQGGEAMWETVSLWKHDIKRCNCTKQGTIWKIAVELKPGALLYGSKDPDDQSHLITILVSSAYPLQHALLKTFKESTVNICTQHKSSAASTPVSVFIEDSRNMAKDSFLDKSGLNCAVKNDCDASQHNDFETCSVSTTSQQGRCQSAKTSVPADPMTTPASSVLSFTDQEQSWYQIEEKLNKTAAIDNFSKNKLSVQKPIELQCTLMPSYSSGSLLKGLELQQQTPFKTEKCSEPTLKHRADFSSAAACQSSRSPQNESIVLESYLTVEEDSQNIQHFRAPLDKHLENILEESKNINPKENEKLNLVKDLAGNHFSTAEDENDSQTVRRSQRNINRNKTKACESKRNPQKPAESNKQSLKSRKKDYKNDSLNKTKCKNRGQANKNGNESSLPLQSDVKDGRCSSNLGLINSRDPKTPPPKNMKSGKKVKTPVVTVKVSHKKADSKPDLINGCLQASKDPALIPASHSVADKCRSMKAALSKDTNIHNNKMVQEPTISSVYEEKKRQASSHRDPECKLDDDIRMESACVKLMRKSIISPGCISEDDFKLPKKIPLQKMRGDKNKSKRDKKSLDKKTEPTHSDFSVDKLKGKKDSQQVIVYSTKNLLETEEQTVNNEIADVCVEHDESKKIERNSLESKEKKKSSEKSAQPRVFENSSNNVKMRKSNFQTECSKKPVDSELHHHVDQELHESQTMKQYPSGKSIKDTSQILPLAPQVSQCKKSCTGNAIEAEFVDTGPENKISVQEGLMVPEGNEINGNSHKDSKAKTNFSSEGYCLPRQTSHAVKSNYKPTLCDDVSSSSSGILYIETVQGTDDLNTDCIVETQCDKLTPTTRLPQNSVDAQNDINYSPPIEPTQFSDKKTINKVYKLKKMKDELKLPANFGFDENELNASGDCNVPNTEPHVSSNMESSYVFDKCGLPKNDSSKVCDQNKNISLKTDGDPIVKIDVLAQDQRQSDRKVDSFVSRLTSGCGDGLMMTNSPEEDRPGRLLKQLRKRNKKISYKEWESNDTSFNDEITPSKSYNTNSSTPSPTHDQVENLGASFIKSPSDDKLRSQKDQHTMKMAGSMAPKKIIKGSRKHQKTFWTSREIKTTVTTSYSKFIDNSYSADPYSFDAECATTSTEAAPLLPFRSFSFDKSHQDESQTPEKQSVNTGTTKGSPNTKLHHRKDGRSGYKEAKHDMTLSEQKNSQFGFKSGNAKRSKDLMTQKKQKKKVSSKDSVEFSLFSSQKRKSKKKERKSKTREQMDIALFSSQRSQAETSKSDSGLVFPPLEDSIPCTPYDDIGSVASDDPLETSTKKSERSWTKAKTPADVQKKMRGKTYNKTKIAHSEYHAELEEDEADMEQGSLYQSLYDKQHHKKSVETNSQATEANTQTPQKLIGTLKMEITPGRSPKFIDEKSSASSQKKKTAKDQVSKTFSSILTTSIKCLKGSSNKKSKRSLSFKSPSDHEASQSDELLDIRDYEVPSLSIPENVTRKISDFKAASDWGICPENLSFNKYKPDNHLEENKNASSNKSWEALSSNLDLHIQDLISSSSEPGDTSDADYNGLKDMLVRKNLLTRDWPPQSILRSRNDSASKTPKRRVLPELPVGNISPFNIPAPVKRPDLKKTLQKEQQNQVSPKKKRRKSRRKLELSPICSRSNEKLKSDSVRAFIDFDLSPYHLSSPEKGRGCLNSASDFDKELCISPYIPLSISVGASPVVGLSHLSSPALSDHSDEQECLPGPTALLDTIKDDLMKPLASQPSEGSSEHSAQLLEMGKHCAPSNTSYSSLRDYLTRRNMAKRPPITNELEDATRPTVKCICNRWNDEQRKRMNAVSRFQSVTEKVLARMSEDIKEINESERLAKLKSALDELREQLQQTESDNSNAQKSVNAVLKKDIEAFKKNLEEKYNAHSLEAIKRCLQTSFMFS
ncbi:synaptonemal complex protein 2-like [Plakobranchus ocellatus]|uniref:Synaptonemal complex protein 2-like n=1 Tax=Plakobranchus ocellatus TaxID=259542 RepID=A0AAV3ZTR6_9GAST|nr:synaptonemal complex protein 2-like [Plakobranchus ocellatus]